MHRILGVRLRRWLTSGVIVGLGRYGRYVLVRVSHRVIVVHYWLLVLRITIHRVAFPLLRLSAAVCGVAVLRVSLVMWHH